MTSLRSLLPFCLVAAACLPLSPVGRSEETNFLSAAERLEGWHLLFDGGTLTGWRALGSPEPGSGWKVVDGAVVRVAKSGDLLTVNEYGDFELSIKWKAERATNSGILYRVGLGEEHSYFTGPEYQLLDDLQGEDRHDPKHLAGALYDLVAPPADYTLPLGEWNLTGIEVRGWHVRHWLNGHKIVDIDLDSPVGRALIAGSKFKAMPHFATLPRGHIALQDHDNEVSFRNIKLRKLLLH